MRGVITRADKNNRPLQKPSCVHLNDLLDGGIGVADVCAFDGSKACTGNIDATENYWGCAAGPGGFACTTMSGSDIRFAPWLVKPIPELFKSDHDMD